MGESYGATANQKLQSPVVAKFFRSTIRSVVWSLRRLLRMEPVPLLSSTGRCSAARYC